MIACYTYIRVHCASFEYIFEAELGLFLVHSSFLLASSSFWPMCSGMTTYSLVALLVAVLLEWMKWMATEPFRNWSKWHSIVGQQIGMNSSDVTRLVATEHARNKFSLFVSRSITCIHLLSKIWDIINFVFNYCTISPLGGFIILSKRFVYKYSTFW